MDLTDSSDADDPRRWSVDRVVQEFCYNNVPRWGTSSNPQLVPNRQDLEHTFRHNDIDGETLLDLDLASLKDDLAIASFGQRRAILKAILFLQGKPTEFQDALRSRRTIESPITVHETFDVSDRAEVSVPARNQLTSHRSQLKIGDLENLSSRGIETPQEASSQHVKTVSDAGSKANLLKAANMTDDVSPTQNANGSASEKNFLDIVEARLDQSLTQQVEYQDSRASTEISDSPKHTITKSKKRMKPTLLSEYPPTSNLDRESIAESLLKSSSGYLGTKALPLHSMVCDNSQPDDFQYEHQQESTALSGLKILTSTRLKYVLRKAAVHLPRSKNVAWLPYNTTRMLAGSSSRQFKLFSPNKSPISNIFTQKPARRRHASLSRDKIVVEHLSRSIAGMMLFEPVASQEVSDLGDFEYLVHKYPANTEDEGLPTYGHSDVDEEYDDTTWQEVMAEQAERQAVQAASTVDTSLTPAQVNGLMDEAIAKFKQDYYSSRPFAIVKWNAYRKWIKAAHLKHRQTQIDDSISWRDRAQRRIPRIRTSILEQVWQKPSDVTKQCRILEESIAQVCAYDYVIEVLCRDTAPTKPPRPFKSGTTRRSSTGNDEESLSESDIESCDDVEDFLVDNGNVLDADQLQPDFDPVLPQSESVRQSPSEHLAIAEQPGYMSEIDFEADIESDAPRAKLKSPKKAREHSSGRRKKAAQTDAAANTSGESDIEGIPRLPKSIYRTKGQTKVQPIDLTFSDPSGRDTEHQYSTTDFEVKTPELNPSDQKPASSKQDRSFTTTSGAFPNLHGQVSALPSLNNFRALKTLDWRVIEELSDHVRALYRYLYNLPRQACESLIKQLEIITNNDIPQESMLRTGFVFSNMDKVVSFDENDKYPARNLLCVCFGVYIRCRWLMGLAYLTKEDKEELVRAIDGAHQDFFKHLRDALAIVQQHLEKYSLKAGTKRKSDLASTSADDTEDDIDIITVESDPNDSLRQLESPLKKKKKVSKQTAAQRKETASSLMSDRQRVADHERRRKLIQEKLLATAAVNQGTIEHIVNSIEPSVYLHPHIATRIKPHQVEGIHFMWREVIENPQHQGCLLAHTMGLGKTMQVIALLVTIELCNQSNDPNIRELIPEHLRTPKTLILVPPSLLDNWMDELYMWIPHDMQNLLGEIWKVAGSKDSANIGHWARNGGVLLISYSLFRSMLPAISNEEQQYVMRKGEVMAKPKGLTPLQRCLTESPNLVIADEAHSMKNPGSKLNICAQLFATSSRIALTGSPLNNSLIEYFTMIDWVAPKYLGSMNDFRAKYSTPIMEGLYKDSTAVETRIALKKLHILKRDIEPKINRAGISSIKQDMPQKTEYIIAIAMTDFQKAAYNLYVEHVVGVHVNEDKGKTGNTKLWSWLGIMSLLCNHPACFVQKLKDQQQRLLGDSSTSANDDSTAPDTPAAATDDDVPEDIGTELPADVEFNRSDVPIIDKLLAVFHKAIGNDSIDQVSLSHRSRLAFQIIEQAIAANDKTLLFSHSIPTLNFLERLLLQSGFTYCRIDGSTKMSSRQALTKQFNSKSADYSVFLISTRAGGLGLNLQGANRVIIFDFCFNPAWEEQAIGRAYRMGQTKPVYVYRFRSGGTYEDKVHEKAVFKTQLFQRVVERKDVARQARKVSEYLYPVKEVERKDYSACIGRDPEVLDKIVQHTDVDYIYSIDLTESFEVEDDEKLTAEELKAADHEYENVRLERENPEAYKILLAERQKTLLADAAKVPASNVKPRGHRKYDIEAPMTGSRPKVSNIQGLNLELYKQGPQGMLLHPSVKVNEQGWPVLDVGFLQSVNHVVIPSASRPSFTSMGPPSSTPHRGFLTTPTAFSTMPADSSYRPQSTNRYGTPPSHLGNSYTSRSEIGYGNLPNEPLNSPMLRQPATAPGSFSCSEAMMNQLSQMQNSGGPNTANESVVFSAPNPQGVRGSFDDNYIPASESNQSARAGQSKDDSDLSRQLDGTFDDVVGGTREREHEHGLEEDRDGDSGCRPQ